MNSYKIYVKDYLEFCQFQKCLDTKTIKAYKIDLEQFFNWVLNNNVSEFTPAALESFIVELHRNCKPKTAKRKIAAVKAFFHYLEYKDIIEFNPFNKINIKFREPIILPKTIPLYMIEMLLSKMYEEMESAKTNFRKLKTLQDIAVVEILFATGIRISELCALKASDINLRDKTILIFGKNSKERIIQIGNDDVMRILVEYQAAFKYYIKNKRLLLRKQKRKPHIRSSSKKNVKKICFYGFNRYVHNPSYVSSHFCHKPFGSRC